MSCSHAVDLGKDVTWKNLWRLASWADFLNQAIKNTKKRVDDEVLRQKEIHISAWDSSQEIIIPEHLTVPKLGRNFRTSDTWTETSKQSKQ